MALVKARQTPRMEGTARVLMKEVLELPLCTGEIAGALAGFGQMGPRHAIARGTGEGLLKRGNGLFIAASQREENAETKGDGLL